MYIYDISHHIMSGETGSITKGSVHGGVWVWIFRDDHHIDV